MSQYRKRFVQFNMLLIGIVLTIMIAAVAVYMVRDYYTGLLSTMQQVVEPLRAFPQPPFTHGDKPPQEGLGGRPEGNRNILTTFYSPESGAYTVLSSNDAFSEEELPELLATIVSQQKQSGILFSYHAVYYYASGNPYRIAIASTDYITHSMVSLCLVLLAIWLGAMGLFLLISRKLAAIAARPMEEAMQREKQFVADASHDLKTPLSVILANTSILGENPDATVGSLSRWLDSTQAAAKRMQQLIGEMLTLADVERTDAPIAMKTVDFASICMKAALEMESLAYEKHVSLDTDLPDSCFVQGNPDYLLRIVSSLLENAMKYEPEGGHVELTLRQERRKVMLNVANRGSVITNEDLPRIFDRFYRSDKSRQTHSGSFGLGLAITREMIQRLGGEISVSSTPETGTVFCVTFAESR